MHLAFNVLVIKRREKGLAFLKYLLPEWYLEKNNQRPQDLPEWMPSSCPEREEQKCYSTAGQSLSVGLADNQFPIIPNGWDSLELSTEWFF